MTALLRSGNLKDYTALGQDGRAVYMIASQIRDTIKIRLGKEFANYLAIPQRNELGNQIDWYVPFDSQEIDGHYFIIPWTSATDDEKIEMLGKLDQFKEKLLTLGKKLNSQENLQGDQLLFSRLLYTEQQSLSEQLKAIRFPNEEHVYLVNGQPVITFWGFSEKQGQLYDDPFFGLRPKALPASTVSTMSAPTESVVTQPVIEKKKNHWCCIPLFLLPLLSLLLFLWWWFKPAWLPQFPLFNNLDTSKEEVAKDTKLVRDPVKNDCVVYSIMGKLLDENGNIVSDSSKCALVLKEVDFPYKRTATGWVGVNGQPVSSDVAKALDANLPNLPNGLASGNDSVEPTNNALPIDAQDASQQSNIQPNAQPDVQNNATTPESAVPNPAVSDTANDPLNTSSNTSLLSSNASNTAPSAQNVTANGALALDPQTLASGNTQVLNGNWTAGAGIQDKATGKPLRLNYQFQDGKGQVKLTRADGVTCVADVQAAIKGGLNINNTSAANCSDGSTYNMPTVVCQPDANGAADCSGQYGNQRFPMSIKSQN